MGIHGASEVLEPTHNRFREVLGNFASGVVAITGMTPSGTPAGLTVTSFTSVSLSPPLVLFCVALTSRTWPRIRHGERCCVNILSQAQDEIATVLARNGAAKFGDVGWSMSPNGLPIVDGVLAWFEASTVAEHRAGDHDIVVARVHDLAPLSTDPPLVRYRSGYRRLSDGPEAT